MQILKGRRFSSFIYLFFERLKPWLKKSEMHGDLPLKL
jgi:hypothetical protein